MTGERYSLRRKKTSPCYRMTRKKSVTRVSGGVQPEQSRKKPKCTSDSNAQEHIEEQSKATIDKVEMHRKSDGTQCTVMKSMDDCENTKSKEKKLKIVIKKNLETGEWSAGEELCSGENKCAHDSLLDCHSGENDNGERKATYLSGTKRKTDCKKQTHKNKIDKIKLEVDMVRKKDHSKVLFGKYSNLPEKTVGLHNDNYCVDELEEDACHLDNPQNVKINQGTLINETCAKHNECQYDSKDVYVVELYDDEVLNKDKELKSQVTENIDESVHIKLFPLSTTTCRKYLSPETEEVDLKSSLNEKEENVFDETGIENCTKEKEAKTKTTNLKAREVKKPSGVNCTDIVQTSEKMKRKNNKQDEEIKSMNGLTLQENPDVDVLDYTVKERFTDLNDNASKRYTEVAEKALPCPNVLLAGNHKDTKETVTEINTDVNEAFARKDDYMNGVVREQESKSVEETGEEDTDFKKVAVNSFNINEKTSEKDLNIPDTKLVPLPHLENLNRSPDNIKDIEELFNLTVSQTLYHNNKIIAETPGTSQTCNMQDNIVAGNHMESKSSEIIDDNNNCLIEVYVLDDKDGTNKTEMVVNNTDSKFEACADSEFKTPKTCEIIVYDDTSDMKNSTCNEPQGSIVSVENQGNFTFDECNRFNGYCVNGMSWKGYMDQRSLSVETWSPVAGGEYISMSPGTDLRYKNIPYWDPCLLPEIKTIDKRCDNKQIPVRQTQQKRKHQTKIETGPGLKFEECDTVDKLVKENYVPTYRASKVSDEAAMRSTFGTIEYDENEEIKQSFINDSITENENTGLIICNTKLADDRKKSLKVENKPTKDKMCLSKNVKQSCNRKNNSVKQNYKRKNDELFIRISDGVSERKKMLRKLKNGQYGHKPHVVRVREGGIVADVTEEYRQHLPYKDMSW